MLNMSLKKFKEKYYPNVSQRALGREMGISDKEFTFIKQQKTNPTEESYKKCAAWLKSMHNVILTYDEPEWVVEQKYNEIIRQKDQEIRELEDKIQELKLELAFRDDFSRCKKYIINQHEKEKATKRKKK